MKLCLSAPPQDGQRAVLKGHKLLVGFWPELLLSSCEELPWCFHSLFTGVSDGFGRVASTCPVFLAGRVVAG